MTISGVRYFAMFMLTFNFEGDYVGNELYITGQYSQLPDRHIERIFKPPKRPLRYRFKPMPRPPKRPNQRPKFPPRL